MRIAITGATGLLGRNLLFEVIRRHAHDLDHLDLIVLGRGGGGASLRQRIEAILTGDGADYLRSVGLDAEALRDVAAAQVTCIEIDLDTDGLTARPTDVATLAARPLDFVFHVAALTDFRSTPTVASALTRTNLVGTQRLLELVGSLTVGELAYVGSAYACGQVSGVIAPDFIPPPVVAFRNAYEQAELAVRQFGATSGVRCRFFRPSTICGRLLEPPLGATCKFDVFYEWAAWFLALKQRALPDMDDRFTTPHYMDLRFAYNPNAGLNIVPVDFAAEAMVQLCLGSDPGDSYHLVNEQETPHQLYTSLMLDTVNVQGICPVTAIPDHQNRIEQLYYRTIGQIYTPYILSPPLRFDTTSVTAGLAGTGLACPAVDHDTFGTLMTYAKAHNFGLPTT